MKKFISVLLSLVMVLSVFSTAAFATDSDFVGEELLPEYSAGDFFSSHISFSGKTVTCKSSITLDEDEKWLSISQTVEREVSSNSWQAVKDCGWIVTDTNGRDYYLFVNSGTVTENGKYRLKSIFMVESVSGKKERIVIYSQTVTI